MLRFIINLVLYLWNFLSSLGGIISLLATMGFLGILDIKEFPKFPIVLQILFVTLLVIGMVFIFRISVVRFRKWRGELETREVEEELSRSKNQSNLKNFNVILPNSKSLERWVRLGDAKGNLWSTDAKRDFVNLYIDKSGSSSGFEIVVQIGYVSDWKNEKLTVYFGHVIGGRIGREKYEKLSRGDFQERVRPFFRYPKWREVVLKSIEKIDSGQVDRLEIQVSSKEGRFDINMRYELGKVGNKLQFSYDGKSLVNLSDNSKTKIL